MEAHVDSFELREKNGEVVKHGVSSPVGGGKGGPFSEKGYMSYHSYDAQLGHFLSLMPLLCGMRAILLEPVHHLSTKAAARFRLAAIVVSWVSVVTSLVLGITATVFGWRNGSQSLLSFGLDALLDCMSSIIVLWRFYGGDSIYSEKREKRACALIGVLLIISSILLGAKSIWALHRSVILVELRVTLILSSVNVVTCAILGLTKVYIGYKLESRALVTDSVITLVGALISVFTLIFAAAYESNKHLWYLDDAFGIAASVCLISYGIVVLWLSLRDGKQSTQTGDTVH